MFFETKNGKRRYREAVALWDRGFHRMNCRGGLVGVVLGFGLVGVASGGPVIVKGQVVYADQRRAVGGQSRLFLAL